MNSSNSEQKCSSCWESYQDFVWETCRHTLQQYFLLPLMTLSARNPITIIVLVTAVSFAISLTALDKVRIMTQSSKISVSQTSYPVLQSQWVQEAFPPVWTTTFLLVPTENNGDDPDVVSVEAIELLFDVHQTALQQIGTANQSYSEQFQWISVTNFWNDSKADFAQFLENSTGLHTFLAEQSNLDRYLGKPTYSSNGTLEKASSWRSTMVLLPDAEEITGRGPSEMERILGAVANNFTHPTWAVEVLNESTLSDDLEEPVFRDLPLVYSAFGIMALFTAVSFQFKRGSRGFLGFGAVVTVILSVITGYGIGAHAGFPITIMTQVLPFVLVGIGLDDSYVLTGAMEQVVNYADPFVETTLQGIVDLAGPSITLTSLTDCLAFALGAIMSTIPAVRWFCYYAVFCIIIDFLYQITLFVALMALDDARIRSKCCICCTCRNEVPQSSSNNRESMMRRYTSVLLLPRVKWLVLIVFAAALIVGAFFSSKVTVDFSIQDLTARGSSTDRFVQAEVEHFGDPTLPCYLYVRDFGSREPIDSFLKALVDSGFVESKADPFILDAFQDFSSKTLQSGSNATSLDQLMEGFLQSQPFWLRDVAIDYDTGTPVAFRTPILAQVNRFASVRRQVEFLQAQRRITLNSTLNANTSEDRIFLFNVEFPVFEHFRIIPRQLTTTLTVAILAVAFVSCFFFPYPSGTLLSVFVVLAVNVELIGLVYVTGKHINTITVLLLIMQVGLTVDYCLHVVFAFQRVKRTSPEIPRNETIILAMEEVGLSVFHGGCTTLLGVLMLGFADGEVFRTFFIIYCAMVVLGVTHGLVFLPVALSLIPMRDTATKVKEGQRLPSEGLPQSFEEEKTDLAA